MVGLIQNLFDGVQNLFNLISLAFDWLVSFIEDSVDFFITVGNSIEVISSLFGVYFDGVILSALITLIGVSVLFMLLGRN